MSGFAIILVVIGVGWVLAARGTLGPGGQRALASLVYAVATPCLLFDTMTHSDPAVLFSSILGVVALSALLVGAFFFLLCRFVLRRSAAESIIGMLSSSYANGGNLGIPLAAYVLGDASVVIPVMLFQIAFYAPLSLSALEVCTSSGRTRWQSQVRTVLGNPMLLSSVFGCVVTLSGWRVPAVIAQPVSILGGASVPLALLVFGMSLRGARVLGEEGRRVDVLLASAAKNLLQPLLSAALGAWVFGMSGEMLRAVVVLGALPTAQNVYTYAVKFRVGEEQARDAGVVSTLVSVPVIMVIALLSHGVPT
nr:AEC family transporter [Corynebacterium uropygiale]